MDSHRLVTQIWDLVATLEAISVRDLQEHAMSDPNSAASLERALQWSALRANQAILELQRMKI